MSSGAPPSTIGSVRRGGDRFQLAAVLDAGEEQRIDADRLIGLGARDGVVDDR